MRSHWLLQLVAAAMLLSASNATAGFNGAIPDTYIYEGFLNTDSDDTTGCDVDAEDANFAGPVPGVEWVVAALIRRSPTSAIIDEVRLLRCVADTLVLQEVIDTGNWAAGLENGINGADIAEFGVPRQSIGNPAEITVGFHTTKANFNDVLLTTNGANGGEDIVFELPPNERVPAMSMLGMGLTALLLMAIAWLSLRRRGQAWTAIATLTLVASIAATAWAVTIALDGSVADWAGIQPIATDITDDSTADDDAEDIVAAFVTADSTNLFFRLDVVNLAPVQCGDGDVESGEDCEEDLDCMPEGETLDRGGAAQMDPCTCQQCQCVNCNPT